MKEISLWRNVMRENNISTLNEACSKGFAKYLVKLAETLHEHRFADIADSIAEKPRVKLVLIAGPSSSGKTTSSKRLSLHMRVNGLNPIIIGLDDYFKNRVDTPLDANGEYDFECLEALDVEFLNKQLTQLFNGEEVEIPHYNFALGRRVFDGTKLKMRESDVLIMEGIHGLNPALTPLVPDEEKFKIYVSVLAPLLVDESMAVSPSDYRLMRRMVRDNQFRGCNAESTILRWPSVRAGEEKYIVPFKENADVLFDTSLIYEMPMLKCYAEPLLQTVRKDSDAYPEAKRLLDILHRLIAMTPAEIKNIPPTSIFREFIGGSSFSY